MNREFSPLGQRDRENSGINRAMGGMRSRMLDTCWIMIQSEYAYKKEQAKQQERDSLVVDAQYA